jgi:hypothetical protein
MNIRNSMAEMSKVTNIRSIFLKNIGEGLYCLQQSHSKEPGTFKMRLCKVKARKYSGLRHAFYFSILFNALD